MYFLSEFLQNRIHKGWWAYKVVDWYCEKRQIELPNGRCHFGEILLFYAPAYLFMGLLFKGILTVLKVAGFILSPLMWPISWFVSKTEEEEKDHPGTVKSIAIASLCALGIAEVVLLTIGYVKDPGNRWLLTTAIPSFVGAPLFTFVFLYLTVWTVPSVVQRVAPVVAFGQEAAQRITVPRFTRSTLYTVGAVVIVPAKGVVIGARQGGVTLKTLWTIARNTWRQRICPRVEYLNSNSLDSIQ